MLKAFALVLTASEAARLTGIGTHSIRAIYLKMRQRIAEYCKTQSPYSGKVEPGGSYFGPRKVRGKRGYGVGSKTIAFGSFKRNDHVYTEIVPDAKKKTLLAVIRGCVNLNSVSKTNG